MANIPVNPNLDKAQRKISTANLANFAGVDCQLLIEKETHRPIIMDGSTVGGAFKVASLDEVDTKLGTLKPSSAGNADTATKLSTARNISISGAVTAAEVAFDGSDNVVLNATAVNGAKVTGVVPEATKATQNAAGEVIEDTYVRKNLAIPSNGSTNTSMQVSGVNGSDSVLTAVQTQISNWKPTLGLLCRNGAQVYTQIVMSENDMTFAIGPSRKVALSTLLDIPSTYATKTEMQAGYLKKTETAAVANKLGTTSVGSSSNPIYLNNGVATAFTETIGTSDTPVYLNAGVLTSCGKTFINTEGGQTINGALTLQGTMYATTFQVSSDIRLKSNLATLINPLSVVEQLTGYTYNLKDGSVEERQAGLIAQEIVKAGFTEAVKPRKDGYLTVNYQAITALLVQAVKELSHRVKTLEEKYGK